jgi:hypothetical protein
MWQRGRSRQARTWWPLAAAALAGSLCLLLSGLASASERPRPVATRTTPATISFAITANSAINFGGVQVGTTTDCIGSCPTIVNNSDLSLLEQAIGQIVVTFDDATEADCGVGGGWEANASTAALDTFVMRVDLDHLDTAGFVAIDPTTGSADLLDGLTTLTPGDGAEALNFQLVMPTSISTGDNQCTIALTITISDPS